MTMISIVLLLFTIYIVSDGFTNPEYQSKHLSYLETFLKSEYNRCYLNASNINALCIKNNIKKGRMELNYANQQYHFTNNNNKWDYINHIKHNKHEFCRNTHNVTLCFTDTDANYIDINVDIIDNNKFSHRVLLNEAINSEELYHYYSNYYMNHFTEQEDMIPIFTGAFSMNNLISVVQSTPKILKRIIDRNKRGFNLLKQQITKMLRKERIVITKGKLMEIFVGIISDSSLLGSTVKLGWELIQATFKAYSTSGASFAADSLLLSVVEFIFAATPRLMNSVAHLFNDNSSTKKLLNVLAALFRGCTNEATMTCANPKIIAKRVAIKIIKKSAKAMINFIQSEIKGLITSTRRRMLLDTDYYHIDYDMNDNHKYTEYWFDNNYNMNDDLELMNLFDYDDDDDDLMVQLFHELNTAAQNDDNSQFMNRMLSAAYDDQEWDKMFLGFIRKLAKKIKKHVRKHINRAKHHVHRLKQLARRKLRQAAARIRKLKQIALRKARQAAQKVRRIAAQMKRRAARLAAKAKRKAAQLTRKAKQQASRLARKAAKIAQKVRHGVKHRIKHIKHGVKHGIKHIKNGIKHGVTFIKQGLNKIKTGFINNVFNKLMNAPFLKNLREKLQKLAEIAKALGNLGKKLLFQNLLGKAFKKTKNNGNLKKMLQESMDDVVDFGWEIPRNILVYLERSDPSKGTRATVDALVDGLTDTIKKYIPKFMNRISALLLGDADNSKSAQILKKLGHKISDFSVNGLNLLIKEIVDEVMLHEEPHSDANNDHSDAKQINPMNTVKARHLIMRMNERHS
eukprot:113010_1